MLGQLNLQGQDRVQTAIKRLQTFEPKEGYYVAFSGGKDSIVIKHLADMAGVKYDAHYNLTSVDPPELVYFIREYHHDVHFNRPLDKDGKQITMWNLIPQKHIPPTRMVRYCCEKLKESQGKNRFVVTGVRKAESVKRSGRSGLENGIGQRRDNFDPDNPSQEMIHLCHTSGKSILNPIIDWSNSDVWEFIRAEKLPYPSLYDEGHTRLGCIGCPMASKKARADHFERWPKYKQAYLRAFARMIEARKAKGLPTERWETPEQVMEWWVRK